MTESLFQFYARQFVLGALSQIQQGQLTVISKYEGATTPKAVFGQQLSKGTDDQGTTVVVVITNPNSWTRICQAFDLVRMWKDLNFSSKLIQYLQGFAEGYMSQEVECENLKGLFTVRNMP
jgi:cyclopropane-fatty-acyl-phospholipid synthase